MTSRKVSLILDSFTRTQEPEMSYDLLINDLEYALTALRVYGTYSGLRHLRNAGVPIEVALLAHAGRFPQAVY